jgi:hypothetical protein
MIDSETSRLVQLNADKGSSGLDQRPYLCNDDGSSGKRNYANVNTDHLNGGRIRSPHGPLRSAGPLTLFVQLGSVAAFAFISALSSFTRRGSCLVECH